MSNLSLLLLRDQRSTSFLAREPSASSAMQTPATTIPPVPNVKIRATNTHRYSSMTSSPAPAPAPTPSSSSLLFSSITLSSPSITMNMVNTCCAAALLLLCACERCGLSLLDFLYRAAFERCVLFSLFFRITPGDQKSRNLFSENAPVSW